MLVQGNTGIDVGDQIRVQLVEVDVYRGYIDFKRVNVSQQ
jgi:translation initiation factor IF-1